ncbi:MAG TPA: hypothetical protein VFM01_00140 [Nakamurella sp.]|jgi:hypothetical protein|nr:hypothetical protein [Nakamurella sp.]
MSYPSSPAPTQSYGNWPVNSYPRDRAVRADVVAAVLLIVGGGAGIAQLWVPWMNAGVENGTTTGWQFFQGIKRMMPGVGFSYTFAAYAILAVAVVGVAMVLLGVLMLLPLDHRPAGIVAVVAGVIGVVCAVWWVFWGPVGDDLAERFRYAWIGWYLFLVAGIVGLIGAIKSLVSAD